jgi:hypothetical protein
MLHLLPDSQPRPAPYAEAVARLASVRHALRLVAPFGAGPASDPSDDEAIAADWDEAGEARRALFDRRSRQLVEAAAAGVEALSAEAVENRRPHAAASEALVAEIRRELVDVAGIVLA